MNLDQPAQRLEEALACMSYRVQPGRFALLAFAEPPQSSDLELLTPPAQLIREAGETSLLIREEALGAALERHPAARVQRGFRWITFATPMGWEVVGFLALVAGALARAKVPIGAVCGFSRDHLFVAQEQLAQTRATLSALFPEAGVAQEH